LTILSRKFQITFAEMHRGESAKTLKEQASYLQGNCEQAINFAS